MQLCSCWNGELYEKAIAIYEYLRYSPLRENIFQLVSVRITQRFAGDGGVRLI
jgi:hypothetical protein